MAIVRSRGGWALADQSVLSLGNFLTNLLLARVLTWYDFGVYAFVLAMLLFLNNMHGAFVGYPLTVRGAAGDDANLRRLLSISLMLTIALLPLQAVLLGTALVIFGHPETFIAAMLALTFWQMQEIARRGLLAKLRYSEAVVGDSISYLGQVAMMYVLARRGELTVERALLLNAGFSAAAMVVQLLQVGLARVRRAEVIEGLTTAWRVSRWLVLSNAIGIFIVPIVPWTLAFYQGAHAVAGFQALSTIMGISHPVLFSVCNIIVPASAQAKAKDGCDAARQAALSYTRRGAMLLMPYYAFLALFPALALRLLYGADSPYAGLTHPLQLFVLFYVLLYFSQTMIAFMNGVEKTGTGLVPQVAGAVATVALAVPLAAKMGLSGAAWGRVIQGSSTVAVSFVLLRQVCDERTGSPSKEGSPC